MGKLLSLINIQHLDSSAHVNKILLTCDSEGCITLFDLLQASSRTKPVFLSNYIIVSQKPLQFAKVSKENNVFRLFTFVPEETSSESNVNEEAEPTETESMNLVDYAYTLATGQKTSKKAKARTGKDIKKFPDPSIGVHRVRWNCNKSKSNWCSFGNALGLVQVVCCKYEPHLPEKKAKKKS